MAEDVVDCVSHVVDICLSVDLLTVSVYHNLSFGFLRGSCDLFLVLVSLPCDFGPGSLVRWLKWGRVCWPPFAVEVEEKFVSVCVGG